MHGLSLTVRERDRTRDGNVLASTGTGSRGTSQRLATTRVKFKANEIWGIARRASSKDCQLPANGHAVDLGVRCVERFEFASRTDQRKVPLALSAIGATDPACIGETVSGHPEHPLRQSELGLAFMHGLDSIP